MTTITFSSFQKTKSEAANPYLSLRVYVKCLDTHENSEVLLQNVRMSVPAFRRIPF